MATMAATCRELTYASCSISIGSKISYATPTLGQILLVSAELVAVIVLCFYALHPSDEWQWEDVGYRTGFIACAQLPLVFLLAGKNNVIALLVGTSYERLNWLHRWTARVLLLTVTIHMGFWFTDWYRFDYIKVKLTTDPITQRGFAAWVIMLWIVISSMAPVRRWNYELFVVQHIVTFSGLIAAVYLHLPAENKVWIWIPIGLLVLDRLLRWLRLLYINIAIFHPKSKSKKLLASRAIFEVLDCETTRITITTPPTSWCPGQHVLLSCHTVAPFQSHPFTIASIPSDGKMEFFVKSKMGGTKRFLEYAEKQQNLPLLEQEYECSQSKTVLLEGPYGRMRPLRQFDSVFLIAGSSGGTFTVPLLRDIVHSWKAVGSEFGSRWSWSGPSGAATRYLRCVWIVKSRAQYRWFGEKLGDVIQDVEQLRREGHNYEVDISVYVTCDESFVAGRKPSLQSEGYATLQGQPGKISWIASSGPNDEKAELNTMSIDLRSSAIDSQQESKSSCGPNGACCCQTTIEDEDAIGSKDAQCQCCCGEPEAKAVRENFKTLTEFDSSENEIRMTATPRTRPIKDNTHPAIAILSGRPQTQSLIRKTLEQALGESAVIVCGPSGLVRNVRQSVVSLSDERAVHKGTGAQGIYLHAEAFEY
ncbi:MAG: hypothetical protein Q9195_002624 [Heterodermia aff. obscurata]